MATINYGPPSGGTSWFIALINNEINHPRLRDDWVRFKQNHPTGKLITFQPAHYIFPDRGMRYNEIALPYGFDGQVIRIGHSPIDPGNLEQKIGLDKAAKTDSVFIYRDLDAPNPGGGNEIQQNRIVGKRWLDLVDYVKRTFYRADYFQDQGWSNGTSTFVTWFSNIPPLVAQATTSTITNTIPKSISPVVTSSCLHISVIDESSFSRTTMQREYDTWQSKNPGSRFYLLQTRRLGLAAESLNNGMRTPGVTYHRDSYPNGGASWASIVSLQTFPRGTIVYLWVDRSGSNRSNIDSLYRNKYTEFKNAVRSAGMQLVLYEESSASREDWIGWHSVQKPCGPITPPATPLPYLPPPTPNPPTPTPIPPTPTTRIIRVKTVVEKVAPTEITSQGECIPSYRPVYFVSFINQVKPGGSDDLKQWNKRANFTDIDSEKIWGDFRKENSGAPFYILQDRKYLETLTAEERETTFNFNKNYQEDAVFEANQQKRLHLPISWEADGSAFIRDINESIFNNSWVADLNLDSAPRGSVVYVSIDQKSIDQMERENPGFYNDFIDDLKAADLIVVYRRPGELSVKDQPNLGNWVDDHAKWMVGSEPGSSGYDDYLKSILRVANQQDQDLAFWDTGCEPPILYYNEVIDQIITCDRGSGQSSDPTGKTIILDDVTSEIVRLIEGKNISLDQVVDGKQLTRDEFKDPKRRFRIIIGDNVEVIPSEEFKDLRFFGNLVIPDNVKTIGDGAFENCNFAKISFTEGNTELELGERCFKNSTDLDRLPEFTYYIDDTTSDRRVENIESNDPIKYDEWINSINVTEDLILPDRIRVVPAEAFSGCCFGGDLTLSERLTRIHTRAFALNFFTGGLKIPSSLERIDSDAFYYHNFKGRLGILRTSNLEIIGTSAFRARPVFSGSANVTGDRASGGGITQTPNNAEWNCISTPAQRFKYTVFNQYRPYTEKETPLCSDRLLDTDFQEISFPNIGGFSGPLYLPNKLKSIGSRAFEACEFSGNLRIPNGVTYIGDRAFAHCKEFRGRLSLSTSLTKTGVMSFAFTRFRDIQLGGLISLGESAEGEISPAIFANCRVKEFKIPITVGKIYSSFAARSIETIWIPNTVTVVPKQIIKASNIFNIYPTPGRAQSSLALNTGIENSDKSLLKTLYLDIPWSVIATAVNRGNIVAALEYWAPKQIKTIYVPDYQLGDYPTDPRIKRWLTYPNPM